MQSPKAPSEWDPLDEFHAFHYVRHNQRRQEHLASLGLPLSKRTVLEVGAGIGDHTSFFLDRGCEVTTTEGRPSNAEVLRRRFPQLGVSLLDLDHPGMHVEPGREIVYCYGTLYHLAHPEEALAYLAGSTDEMLLLETCVTPGDDEALNPVEEDTQSPSQAVGGIGCRPTRPWVWARLARHFPYVYVTATQPWHEEFPLDWTVPAAVGRLTRAVFVASRSPIENDQLLPSIPSRQVRH